MFINISPGTWPPSGRGTAVFLEEKEVGLSECPGAANRRAKKGGPQSGKGGKGPPFEEKGVTT